MKKKYPLTIKELMMIWVIKNMTLEEVFIFDILALEKRIHKMTVPQGIKDNVWGERTLIRIRKSLGLSCTIIIDFDIRLKLNKLEEYYRLLYIAAYPILFPVSKWSIQQFKTRYNLNKIILKDSEIMREGNN